MENASTANDPPIACTLTGDDFKQRLAWIAALSREALHSHEQHGLVLDLHYALEAAERVREMVRQEKACCAFLTFDLQEDQQEIRLTISAPENAREMAGLLFQEFVAAVPPCLSPADCCHLKK